MRSVLALACCAVAAGCTPTLVGTFGRVLSLETFTYLAPSHSQQLSLIPVWFHNRCVRSDGSWIEVEGGDGIFVKTTAGRSEVIGFRGLDPFRTYRRQRLTAAFVSACSLLVVDANDGRVFVSDVSSLVSERLTDHPAALLFIDRTQR